MKFKKGDVIERAPYCQGFEKATVTGVIKKDGKKYYALKIMCGIATIPVTMEVNYNLIKK